MKRIIIVLTLLLGYLSPTVYGQLTLDSCQQRARANYPLVKRYNLIEKSNEYSLANAGKNYLPQFAVSAKATYQSDVTKMPVSIPGIAIEGVSKDQYGVTLDVTQSIWDGGTTQAQKRIIKAGSDVEKRQLDVEVYKLTDRVNQLYFGILLVDEQLEQNRLLQEDLERNYQRISGYAANGMANQADLDAVRVEQLKAIQQRTHAEATRKAYMEMLGVMTDLPLNQSTQLVKPDVEELSLTAEVKRPELQLFEAQENLFDVQRLKIKSAYMPKLNLFVQGGYGNPGLNMLENKFSAYYLGGVRLSWNFGALYTQKNDVRKLGLNKQDVSAQRETFLYNLAMETRQENTSIGKLKQLMTYDNEIITLRENVRKSAEAKVANGTLTVIELMREINAENLARQEKAAHEIELLLSLSNLKTTMNN